MAGTEQDNLLEVNNVTVSYPVRVGYFRWKKYTPLKDISFCLRKGETLGVIGRNGVGKSTLLRLLAGVISPDKGEVVNYGATMSLLSLGVGFVAHLTGRENAILSGMLLGLRYREIINKMQDIIEYSGLSEFIDQPLRTYSSGMRARLAFTVAIQVNPDVLLIDEVLGVGDEDFKKKSGEEIKRRMRSDKSVVLVSHNLNVIRNMCDRVLWIEDGVVQSINEPLFVIREYQKNSK